MRKIFSRFHKTKQPNQNISQENSQENSMISDDQSSQSITISENNDDQQLSDSQDNIALQEISNSFSHRNSYLASVEDDEISISDNDFPPPPPQSTIKHASTLPMHSSAFYYTVQDGDTVQSISSKFKVKESLIRIANRIYDDNKLNVGEAIQLFTDVDLPQKIPPIDVHVYDSKDQTDGLPGKLYIKKHSLIFSRKSLFHQNHYINLSGYLESDVFPHPSQFLTSEARDIQLSILVVNYLKDPKDKSTSVSEYFSGAKDDLEKIRVEIIKTADIAQEKVNYVPLNPNLIFYSQEFAETASIPTKKRRSTRGRNQEGPRITGSGVQTMKVFLPQIQFLNGQLNILKKTDVFLVRKKLPPRFQNSNWSRLYTSMDDGFLLSTFYRKVTGQKPLLFFLKTIDGDLLGAFIPSGMVVSNSFYGAIDTFVFRLRTEIPTHDIFITRLTDRDDDREKKGTTSHDDGEAGAGKVEQTIPEVSSQEKTEDNHGEQVNSEENDQNDKENSEVNDQNDKENSEVNDQNEQDEEEQENSEDKGNPEENDHSSPDASTPAGGLNEVVQKDNKNSEANDQKIHPQATSNASARAHTPRTVIDAFKWNKLRSFENRNFVFSSTENILFGGGDSSAIYIDSDMYNGYSDPCETFGSPRLTKKKKFRISIIEAWQLI